MSILSERRVFQPYGMNGGRPGKRGENWLLRRHANGLRRINFGGKNATMMNVGDRLVVETPGGGGMCSLLLFSFRID